MQGDLRELEGRQRLVISKNVEQLINGAVFEAPFFLYISIAVSVVL